MGFGVFTMMPKGGGGGSIHLGCIIVHVFLQQKNLSIFFIIQLCLIFYYFATVIADANIPQA
jgi:hypothetical protein